MIISVRPSSLCFLPFCMLKPRGSFYRIIIMHQFHMFLASVGIGVATGVRWELNPLLTGVLTGAIYSLLVLIGC